MEKLTGSQKLFPSRPFPPETVAFASALLGLGHPSPAVFFQLGTMLGLQRGLVGQIERRLAPSPPRQQAEVTGSELVTHDL